MARCTHPGCGRETKYLPTVPLKPPNLCLNHYLEKLEAEEDARVLDRIIDDAAGVPEDDEPRRAADYNSGHYPDDGCGTFLPAKQIEAKP